MFIMYTTPNHVTCIVLMQEEEEEEEEKEEEEETEGPSLGHELPDSVSLYDSQDIILDGLNGSVKRIRPHTFSGSLDGR